MQSGMSMRDLLKRFLTFMDSNNRRLFGFCWFFLVSPVFSRFLLRDFGESSEEGPPPLESLAVIALIIISFWGWRILWKILQRERLLPVKDVVITLGGFMLIHFMLFLPSIAAAAALGFLLPKAIGGTLFTFFMMLIPFISGCWIGFKRDRLIWLWCVAGMHLFWLFIGVNRPEGYFPSWDYYISHIVVVIMGGYFARTQLCEDEDAADLSQVSYQPPE